MTNITIKTTRESLENRFLHFGMAANALVALKLNTEDRESSSRSIAEQLVEQLEAESKAIPSATPSVPVFETPEERVSATMWVIRKRLTHNLLVPMLFINMADATDSLMALTKPSERDNYVIEPVKTLPAPLKK